MASGVRGVTAFPFASVCVIKSGMGASLCAGVLFIPGDLKSVDPRILPSGVVAETDVVGVEAAVFGVSN